MREFILGIETSARSPLMVRFGGPSVRVGRASDNDVVLDDPSVSRHHCEFSRRGDGWTLRDRDSRHGTYLNGVRLTQPTPVDAGDRIQTGAIVLQVEGVARPRRSMPTAPEGTGSDEPDVAAERFVGVSAATVRVRDLLSRLAAEDLSVLVTGESGTGKELVARCLHDRSRRSDKPFVVVNCPALPDSLIEAELFGTERGVATGVEARPGLLEMADGGTLFLDEIGDLSPSAQAKLLRFLHDHVVQRVGSRKPQSLDVRIVAATNTPLDELAARGLFRLDLLYRLSVTEIRIPALRERREDIPVLAEHFLSTGVLPVPHVTPEASDLLQAHDYPGNVRELEHALRAAVLVGDGSTLRPEDLPSAFVPRDRKPEARRAETSPQDLRRAIVFDGGSFWEVVRDPFLARHLSRETVVAFVDTVYAEAGHRYVRMARLLGLGSEYKRLMDFLRHHDLRPNRG